MKTLGEFQAERDKVQKAEAEAHVKRCRRLPHKKYETVLATYVMNVLPVKRQAEVIRQVRQHLAPGGRAYITVRSDVKRDGVTGKGTYQRDVHLPLLTVGRPSGARIYRLGKAA